MLRCLAPKLVSGSSRGGPLFSIYKGSWLSKSGSIALWKAFLAGMLRLIISLFMSFRASSYEF